MKADSRFLRNENPDKSKKFLVISRYMGIFQCHLAYVIKIRSGKWILFCSLLNPVGVATVGQNLEGGWRCLFIMSSFIVIHIKMIFFPNNSYHWPSASGQNPQNDLCVQWRLRSAQSDQTSLSICLLFGSLATHTIMFLSFRTDRSRQTVQTQLRLLLEEQSDQGLHCLQFLLHLLDASL